MDKKRIIYLASLVVLLIVVGVVNHRLTLRRARTSTNEYQQHEANMMKKMNMANLDGDSKSTMSEEYDDNNAESFKIIDSEVSKLDDIGDETSTKINKKIADENEKNDNYFVECRLSRDKLRANQIERLNEIVDNDNTTKDIRTKAQQQIMDIGNISKKELHIEGLIKAKGYKDAILFINNKNVSVVVDVENLNEQDVAKILSVVKEETDMSATNIKIMKKQ
ncbi:SpoIIIAH-like family protein [Clostridiaceae bacterium M8S5]|nr:SpoIIIAH-like family protein [Clostridiaceae bacterium M8S5]